VELIRRSLLLGRQTLRRQILVIHVTGHDLVIIHHPLHYEIFNKLAQTKLELVEWISTLELDHLFVMSRLLANLSGRMTLRYSFVRPAEQIADARYEVCGLRVGFSGRSVTPSASRLGI
jgi:hypothetical protein